MGVNEWRMHTDGMLQNQLRVYNRQLTSLNCCIVIIFESWWKIDHIYNYWSIDCVENTVDSWEFYCRWFVFHIWCIDLIHYFQILIMICRESSCWEHDCKVEFLLIRVSWMYFENKWNEVHIVLRSSEFMKEEQGYRSFRKMSSFSIQW